MSESTDRGMALKKTSILLVLCLVIAALSACGGGAGQESEPEQAGELVQASESAQANKPEQDDVGSGAATDAREPVVPLPPATTVEGQIERILSGDFSNVTGIPDWICEHLESNYDSERYEWVECELNGDGLKGLLWREKRSPPQRIDAIFAVKDNEVMLVDATFGRQGTESFFLCDNGNIIYTYYFGGLDTMSHYTHCIYHEDGSKEAVDSVTVVRTWEWAIEEMREDGRYDGWLKANPYWAGPEPGVHYVRNYYTGEGEPVVLDEACFLKVYEEMTGYSFYDDNPFKPDWD